MVFIRLLNAALRSTVPPAAALACLACTTNPMTGELPQTATPAASPGAESRSEADWPVYNKTYEAARYSTLAQITRANVSRLQPVCAAELGDAGAFQAGPIVVGDTIYLTTANSTVALDAVSCDIRWQNIYENEEAPVFAVNRGVAYAGGRVFRGTADGRVLAIDAATGRTAWKIKAAEPAAGEFFSAAPIAWNGLVYLGIAGSDWAVRGRMLAFDAATGAEKWRFYTVPEGDEPGANTWKRHAGVTVGGGGTWSSYTLDPRTGELFVPVGNPAPDLRSDLREGDNLYTNCLLVLDALTGKLRWYFQMTPNDGLDLDLGAAPALYSGSGGEALLSAGSKDGFLYGIDRGTHKLLYRTAVTTVKNSDTMRMAPPEGLEFCPGYLGGVEWNGPAVDPSDQSVFVGAVDWCMFFHPGDKPYQRGIPYHGTVVVLPQKVLGSGWITSIDGNSGKIRWQYHSSSPIVAALTPTAGGLLLGGDVLGHFLVFDSKTGDVLLNRDMGGAMNGGIVTYEKGGRQLIAVTSGSTSRSGLGNSGMPTLTIFALADDTPPVHRVRVAVDPLRGRLAKLDAHGRGEAMFGQFCSTCHAPDASGGIGPDLRVYKEPAVIAGFIRSPVAPMPKLYPGVLTEQDIDEIADFVARLKGDDASPGAASH
jgi:alcohol dehydrogenase (cytochrome c)